MTLSIDSTRATRSLLARLIESPDLVRTVRSLSPTLFASTIREVGLEDAGEIVALATTEQLVATFDEDLFTNERPGERETFDAKRFVTWLEVLVEAGDSVAAARLVELSEDFVLTAITGLVRVFDHDELRDRLSVDDDYNDEAAAADKALESSLCMEIDGYLLVSREGEGWDAVLSVLLALDRDHRAYLERLLDRASRLSSSLLDDLDELHTALTESDSLAEDVEAEREERLRAKGFVDPRGAQNFLTLAQDSTPPTERDPVTRAYFRELDRTSCEAAPPLTAPHTAETALLRAADTAQVPPLANALTRAKTDAARQAPIVDALRHLGEESPATFAERLDELAYLVNVLYAGATTANGGRMTTVDAAEAALATVSFGAELAAAEAVVPAIDTPELAAARLLAVISTQHADLLFRRACGALAAQGAAPFIRSLDAFQGFRQTNHPDRHLSAKKVRGSARLPSG